MKNKTFQSIPGDVLHSDSLVGLEVELVVVGPGGDNVGLEREVDGAVVVVVTDVDSDEEDVLVAGPVLVVVIDTDVDPGEEESLLDGVVVEPAPPGGKDS